MTNNDTKSCNIYSDILRNAKYIQISDKYNYYRRVKYVKHIVAHCCGFYLITIDSY